MLKKCPNCGVEFETTNAIKKYCNGECCQAFHNERLAELRKKKEKKTCVICGKEFETRRSNQKCCCLYCQKEYKHKYNRLFLRKFREKQISIPKAEYEQLKADAGKWRRHLEEMENGKCRIATD